MIATLPELKTPKLPADGKFMPTLVIDSREQTPLQFVNLPCVTSGLKTGDYSVVGLEDDFAVERKTLPDLFGSLTSGRERFMREMHRMRSYHFARLLIIGSEAEISMGSSRARGINPKAILHSLAAIEARGVPVCFSPSPTAAAALIEKWAFWRAREVLKIASELSKSHPTQATSQNTP